MKVKIADSAYYLPAHTVTNQELHGENPTWNIHQLEQSTGVVKRHIAADGETALDLAFKACKKLFSHNKEAMDRIDGIIFCTQGGDYIMPPNACILHKMLDLGEQVFAFDFNLACSGYIYGIALAQGLISSGTAKTILLINADTYSKYIHQHDRSARVLFGDGAAVSLITISDSTQGIIDIQCATSGKGYDNFIIPAGGCRLPKSKDTAVPQTDASGNVRTLEHIHMDGMAILAFVNSKVSHHIHSTLTRNKLTIDDIDLFVFHQASRVALDSLTRILNIESDKVFRNLREIGNTVSASIPIALKDALDKGRIARGDTVLASGFGVGFSWGTAIIKM